MGKDLALQRIALPWIIDVVEAVSKIDMLYAGSVSNQSWIIFNARNQLHSLMQLSVYRPHLRISREKSNTLQQYLDGMVASSPGADAVYNEFQVWQAKSLKDQFRTVFLSETSTLPIFLVGSKESFDVNLLVDSGQELFPASLLIKVPEAISDAQQVGKALAFELGTAAGFHTFRVTESVLKHYWDHVAPSGKSRPKPETIGRFADELTKHQYGDEKIGESLKQMTRLHRNPLAHPDVQLSVEEAIETLGIARSVVGAMLRVLPEPLQTSSGLAQIFDPTSQ